MNTQEQAQDPVATYLARVDALLSEIASWLDRRGIPYERKTAEVVEEEFGTYEVPVLFIPTPQHDRLFEVRPYGASVIGAEGRVDIKGRIERIALVYFTPPGPTVVRKTLARTAEGTRTEESVPRPMWRGITARGWYWVADPRNARVQLLDETLFFDLVSRVTDYDLD